MYSFFIENEVDKRGKLYKAISKYGYIVEMNGLSEKELLYWIVRECKRNKFQIETKIASYLLYVVGGEMIQLEKRLKSLVLFYQKMHKLHLKILILFVQNH